MVPGGCAAPFERCFCKSSAPIASEEAGVAAEPDEESNLRHDREVHMNQPHVLVVDVTTSPSVSSCARHSSSGNRSRRSASRGGGRQAAPRTDSRRRWCSTSRLPGIDGLFFCGRLRESPQTARTPIIAIEWVGAERRIGPGGGSDRVSSRSRSTHWSCWRCSNGRLASPRSRTPWRGLAFPTRTQR